MSYFNCSFPHNSEDCNNVTFAYNQGIDSYLEGFTESRAYFDLTHNYNRLYLDIENIHEFQILIRRLLELGTESSESLADDMIYVQFDFEVI